jgi:multiple sugar transport system permease protein
MAQARRFQLARISQLFSGARGRDLKETLTAYLFLAPGLFLIFLFGIFPVGFALYVSLHKWLIVRGDYLGITNYVDALSSLAYISIFAMGIGALLLAFKRATDIRTQIRAKSGSLWWFALPGALWAAAIFAFLRWIFYQLPEFLDIADKMRGLERTRELFLTLLSEAFRAESVWPHWQQFLIVLALAVVASFAARRMIPTPDKQSYQAQFTLLWLTLATGIGLLVLTFNSITATYAAAIETGEDPGIWPQLIIITSGVVLLLLAWRLWKRAEKRIGNASFVLHLLAALGLMVGAVVLIIQVPTIMAMGDQDLWDGLKITVFFSFGTVPVQLAIALFLSVLLFQRIKGSGFFRVVYFLPYVTPAVASATVFRLLFSERETAPVNAVLGLFGIGAQRWLREAKGILSMAAESLNIAGYPASIIPTWLPQDLGALLANWLTGPSQAMLVVIMLSVWTFVGYNVVIYLAGLANIPSEIMEAAEIDGANRWQAFRNITFPLLSPTTYFLSLIAVIGTFKAFNTMWVMRLGESLGTIDTISILIFDEFFNRTRYGYASALAFILFAMILALTLINNRVQGSRVFYG